MKLFTKQLFIVALGLPLMIGLWMRGMVGSAAFIAPIFLLVALMKVINRPALIAYILLLQLPSIQLIRYDFSPNPRLAAWWVGYAAIVHLLAVGVLFMQIRFAKVAIRRPANVSPVSK